MHLLFDRYLELYSTLLIINFKIELVVVSLTILVIQKANLCHTIIIIIGLCVPHNDTKS